MKIVLYSDIHAQLAPLDAAQEAVAKENENGWLPHGGRIAKMVRTGEFWNPAHMPH